MTKLDAGLITSLPASDPGSAAVWGSKRINPRPQFCLCLAWSGCPSNDDDDDLIEQKLSNNLVRSFRRWVNKEHKDKPITVDLLIVFLQDETELEERLQTIFEKPRSATVNQLRSEFLEFCKLCDQSRHRFVDCAVFLKCTHHNKEQKLCVNLGDALLALHRCTAHLKIAATDDDVRHVIILITRCSLAYSATHQLVKLKL